MPCILALPEVGDLLELDVHIEILDAWTHRARFAGHVLLVFFAFLVQVELHIYRKLCEAGQLIGRVPAHGKGQGLCSLTAPLVGVKRDQYCHGRTSQFPHAFPQPSHSSFAFSWGIMLLSLPW